MRHPRFFSIQIHLSRMPLNYLHVCVLSSHPYCFPYYYPSLSSEYSQSYLLTIKCSFTMELPLLPNDKITFTWTQTPLLLKQISVDQLIVSGLIHPHTARPPSSVYLSGASIFSYSMISLKSIPLKVLAKLSYIHIYVHVIQDFARCGWHRWLFKLWFP